MVREIGVSGYITMRRARQIGRVEEIDTEDSNDE